MKKKILIFSLAYYPNFVGGAEVAIKEITDRIAPSDIEFHMVTLRFDSAAPKFSKEGNVTVHRVGWGRRGVRAAQTFTLGFYFSKIIFIPLAALKAIRLNRAHHFDGFWAMMSYMLFPIVLLRFAGVRAPYALTLQEGDPFERVFARWYILPFRPLLALGVRHARVVQTISNFLAEWARALGFRGRIEVIPNAVDVTHFSQSYSADELGAVKEKLKKREGDVFLITTSRLVEKNAVDDVIRAMAQLPAPVRFLVLGTGPDEAMARALATELGVLDRVHFLGHVSHAELPKYLKVSDIFIRPSRSEGMGNSFVEAMAAGLPVIATQEGGIADFLFDAKRNPEKPTTGWAVERDSPTQIAEAVDTILANPEKVKKVIATAKQMVIEKYDWNLIAKNMHERIFRPLLNV